MNTVPVLPNKNVGEAPKVPDGWSQLESGFIVPGRLAQEVGGMARDERIADGQEKVDALKSRAKDVLGKMMQGLREGFYIGVSRGAELSGQLAEKGAEAKEAAGNAWAAAKAKTSELFNKGRDFIAQQAENVRGRKAARLATRQERIAELDSRQAERTDREQARQYMKELRAGQDIAAEAADRQAGELVDQAEEVLAEAGRKLNETNKQLAEAGRKLNETNKQLAEAVRQERAARAEAEAAARAAETAMAEADQNPESEELRFVAEEKAGLSTAANAKLKRASLKVQNLEAAASRLAAKAERAARTAENAQERIENRRQQAERRKAERVAARREARGDKWESAKDRVMRIANNDPNWLKRFGAKAAIASGKLARKVVDGLVSAGRGFAEGWREAAAQKAPQAVPVRVQN